MPQLTISDVARQVGLEPSAIRYYEQIGILHPAERISGRRRYDTSVIYRLAVIQRARQIGFTLEEIRHLFLGFGNSTHVSKRWQELSRRKLQELDQMMDAVKSMRRLMERMLKKCHCDTLEQCGKGIYDSRFRKSPMKSRSAASRT